MIQSPEKANSELPVTKAGLFLYGLGNNQKLHCVVPFTQGRFSDDRMKYYALPKGSMDPGERNPLITALREFEEETGIEIEKFLGEKATADLLAGKSIKNLKSPSYSGVFIKHMEAQPIADHTYRSAYGKRHRCHYFAVKVEGIENLKPHLKTVIGSHNTPAPRVQRTTRKMTKTMGYPSLEQMLEILRTGDVPATPGQSWAPANPERIFWNPKLPALEKIWLRERGVSDREKLNTEEWVEFTHSLEGSLYKPLIDNLEAVQKYFAGRGLVSDSGRRLKLDIRDRPLHFYQESAEILPLQDIVARIYKLAENNPYYACALFGEHDDPKHPAPLGDVKYKSGQIFPFFDYFHGLAPDDVKQGTEIGKSGKAILELGAGKQRRSSVLQLLDARAEKPTANFRG
jgi:hypothetical protein